MSQWNINGMLGNKTRDEILARYSTEQTKEQQDSTQALISIQKRIHEIDVFTRHSYLTVEELALIRCHCVDAQLELNRINSWAAYEMNSRTTKVGE